MKKVFLLFPVMALCYMLMTGQKAPEAEKWNLAMPSWISDPSVRVSSQLPSENDYFNPNTQTRYISTPNGVLVIAPNVRVLPRSNSYQSETIISRHPLNPLIMYGSSNAINNVGGSLFISEGVYVTTNGGANWFGNDTMLNTSGGILTGHGGDPGTTIDKDGRFIVSHLGGGIKANYSTNNGLNWSADVTIITGSQDKNFSGTDDAPSSPYYGRSYTIWSRFSAASPPAAISYTTNGGVSWSVAADINVPPAGHYSQGVDIRVGPNGEVYTIWAAPISGSPFTEDFCGFGKSTDGGVTWTVNNNIFDMNGIRGTFASKSGIRVNSFPRIDVDRSGGSRNGWVYIATTGRNISPAGADADVLLYSSSNGGANWSSGVRVNQDPINNGKLQWFPVVRVDEAGGVNVVYYDDRNTASDSSEIYLSRSLDGGVTWTDALVSDHRFKPKPITLSGIAGGYQGDYIGLTSGNSRLWPLWMDDVTGVYQAWTAGIVLANYPLNTFNLTTPAAGSRIVSFPNSSVQSTFNWDTSASTASYKWIFGSPTTSPRKITLPTTGNNISISAGQLDVILAGLGLAQGDSLVGQWDIWAFRNNQTNDSLKASNGPRTLTLKRGVPALSAFNLNSPPTGTTITTSVFNTSNININWTRSGQGVTYKWKFGSPAISNVRLALQSNSSGFDTNLTVANNQLDGILSGLGLNPGDSLVGQWAVWAYNASDSIKSTQTFALTLKRQAKGDVIILYDSALANCRISRDSIANNLSALSTTFDLFNRGTNTGVNAISLRGYKKVIVLGEGTSVMSNVVKDSIKSYLASGGTTNTTKAKLIIMAEDVGYHLDRTGSTYLDTAFARGTLGLQFVADRPGSVGTRGLIGVTTNPGAADSTSGPWPDVLRKPNQISANQFYPLYKFRLYPDSLNGTGRIGSTYNVAIMGIDVESLRPAPDSPPGSPVRRFLKGAIDFVDGIFVNVNPNAITTLPTVFSLAQNYPNPFNPATVISYQLPVSSLVTLKIYDVLGKEVMTLVNEQKQAGSYKVDFNGINLASGAYFYRMEAGEFTDIKRMMLIK
ncbi:MAG: T9SS type A sorting domain-containing protein [bacterium]|nr:T9SS type A sorting domain-containing protein [bacterium]